MTRSERAALARQVVPRDWAVKGHLAFMQPVEHTLRGIHFDSSANQRVTYVSWFYLPLWLPRESVTLGLANRMGNRWNVDEPGIVEQLRDRVAREALPILNAIRTPYDVVRAIRAGVGEREPTLREREELAYALARLNDPGASEAFDKLLTLFDPAVEWQRDMAARALFFREQLIQSPDAAMRQLLAWEQTSLRNLAL